MQQVGTPAVGMPFPRRRCCCILAFAPVLSSAQHPSGAGAEAHDETGVKTGRAYPKDENPAAPTGAVLSGSVPLELLSAPG